MTTDTIIGAGPVGLSCALMRARSGSTVTLIDKAEPIVAAQDARSLALSFGSIQILQALGLNLKNIAHAPIEHIHISEHGGWGHTQLHHTDMHVPMLGAVVRYGDLVAQLTELTQSYDNIQHIRPASVVAIAESNNQNHITLNHGSIQSADVLIHAEGGLFQPDAPSDQNSTQYDYQQTALISNATLTKAKPAWAWERFTAHGPCALLPTSSDGVHFNLVWCMSRTSADALLLLDDAEFLLKLNQAVRHLTGTVRTTTARNAFALGLKSASELHSSIRVAIGNAAQTLHPVAGQGFNLGLRDAFVLNQSLNTQPSVAQAIRYFTQQRHIDRSATVRITDSLARGFVHDFGLTHLRSAGFAAINALPFVKDKIAQQFMFGVR
jgi:2-octaprenyl-6-methoxyphenol hydroxylase